MKIVSNRSGAFLTGTDVADAVMRYTLELCRRRDVALVDIPVLDSVGDHRRWELVIGWRTYTSAMSAADHPQGEMVDDRTVAYLGDQTARLGLMRAEAFSEEDLQADRITFGREDYLAL